MTLELIEAREKRDRIGVVACPNCRIAMCLVYIKPVAGELALHETVYQCPQCSAKTTRWVSP